MSRKTALEGIIALAEVPAGKTRETFSQGLARLSRRALHRYLAKLLNQREKEEKRKEKEVAELRAKLFKAQNQEHLTGATLALLKKDRSRVRRSREWHDIHASGIDLEED